LLAQRIIEIAQRGERDRRRIVDEALAQFVSSKR
jgi:predicted transcriptional regulator